MPDTSLHKHYTSWNDLKKHRRQMGKQTLQKLFAANAQRHKTFHLSAAGLNLNYSRNLINEDTLPIFNKLWKQAKLSEAIKDLLKGKKVNITENRAAWHTALRSSKPNQEVAATLKQMTLLVNQIHSGKWKGYSGKAITDIVNIGIGGSDLGPRMATYALRAFHQTNEDGHRKVKCHFVANVDPAELSESLKKLNPETTLFIIASKSFTTLETLANAKLARQWFLLKAGHAEIPKHFVAISTATDKVKQFGIPEKNTFPLWDWVGGRYSLWSAIGLPIALACGMENFKALLKGAEAMDKHFSKAHGTDNMPAVLAMLEIWYSHFYNAQTQAILPYSHYLKLLPEFLQQTVMESNGKQVTLKGKDVDYPTGSILWGQAGTIGQHSFHQLLHQGTHLIPADFILPLQIARPDFDKTDNYNEEIQEQQRQLVANCLAQCQALLEGKDLKTVKAELKQQGLSAAEINKLAPHQVIPGNRPHNIISFDQLTPEALGALIALYEHKVYVQSVILQINAFDQWGVELGKKLSHPIHDALTDPKAKCEDPGTAAIIKRFHKVTD